jgi:two-component system, chemotaxis family, response regulator WspR
MKPDEVKIAEHFAVMVLLVDDQPIIGEAVRRALAGQSDIAFHYCDDPAQAVSVAERIQPTVILQDLVMPGIDGLTLVRRYRANPLIADTPVIVLSTKEDPKVKSDAFAAGASDYLVKLPDTIELIARLRHHSTTYLLRVQRDAAHRALHESQRQLLQINLELQRLTNVDGLTGLSNRRYLNEYLGLQWKLAVREQTDFSILMIDVDDFKRYNDTYGHLAGDEVLKQVAASIQASFRRPTDFAARFGGEEFIVVLSHTPVPAAEALGAGLCKRIADLQIAYSESSPGKRVTVSIGGASIVPHQSDSVLALIGTADKALYEAKRSGKNRIVMRGASFVPEMDLPECAGEHT